MARTQMRLDAVTGSVVDLKPAGLAAGAAPASFVAADLQDILKGYAQAIANIHGSADFTSQEPGLHTQMTRIKGGDFKVQAADGSDKFVVQNGPGHVSGSGDHVFRGNYQHELRAEENDLSIKAAMGRMKISAGLNQKVEIVGMGTGAVDTWSGGGLKFSVAPAHISASVLTVVQDLRSENVGGVDGSLVFRDGLKQLRSFNDLKWDGANLLAPSVNVGDLTATHVVFAGVSGDLSGSGDMTYSAGSKVLTVDGSTFGNSVTIAGNLTVNGTTTTVNSTTLTVDDKNIELGSVGSPDETTADGGGITLKGAYDHTILYGQAAKTWTFNDAIKAKSGSFDNLASRLAKSDAQGKLVNAEITDFMQGTANQVIVGAVDGSGMSTLSLPQSIHTGAKVTFAEVTGSTGVYGAKLFSAVASAEYIYADAAGELKAGAFQASGDDMVISDALGSVTYSLKFPISGSAAAANLLSTNYISADLSVFGALRSLDSQLKSVADTVGASSKKAIAEIGSLKTSGTDVKGDLSDSTWLGELTVANSMVFVNGQLMLSGALGAKDYTTDGGVLKFAFDLVKDDVVVVQKA